MGKEGIVVATTGQKARLLGLITGVLELVRDGKRDIEEVCRILQVIKDQRDFASALGRGYQISTASVSCLLTVNYDLSIEEAVELGGYGWKNDNITSSDFPTKRKGTAEVALDLIHFPLDISIENVLRELDETGYRPAEPHELLAFGEKYPDIQKKFPIVALASVWQRPGKVRRVPSLDWNGSQRTLNLIWLGSAWSERSRFAAVRK